MLEKVMQNKEGPKFGSLIAGKGYRSTVCLAKGRPRQNTGKVPTSADAVNRNHIEKDGNRVLGRQGES